MEDGNTSLEDWEAFTWSFGWTRRPPSRSLARLAITSFMFMLEEVPDPVWKMSIGNWLSCLPATISAAASAIASANSGSAPSAPFTRAAAA